MSDPNKLALEGMRELLDLFGPEAIERLTRGDCPCCGEPVVITQNTPKPRRAMALSCRCGFSFYIEIVVPAPTSAVAN